MAAQNDDSLAIFSRKALKPNAQINFFSGEKFFAEAAAFPKHHCLAKNERASHP